jgi:hypothetical protein
MLVDCYNQTFVDGIRDSFPEVTMVLPTDTSEKKSNKRHMNNLQQLVEMVHTKWWFHCEDDWEFTRGGFVEESINTLDGSEDSATYMIIGREPNSFKPYVDYWVDERYGVLRINSGPGGAFVSYTANPAIINVGKARALIGRFNDYKAESAISDFLGTTNRSRVGIFRKQYYKHIGEGRTSMT